VLTSTGVKKGNLVLLIMKPKPAWWEIVTACLRMGVVVSPGTTQLSSKDETRVEIVKAYIVLTKDFEPSDELAREIQNHVKLVTAPFKYPRKIEFISELPKTVSGKIRRVELRTREWA